MLVILNPNGKKAHQTMINLEVNPLKVGDMIKEKVGMEKEEQEEATIFDKIIFSAIIFKEEETESSLNKGVEFAIEVVMLIKTVGSRESHNVTIAQIWACQEELSSHK